MRVFVLPQTYVFSRFCHHQPYLPATRRCVMLPCVALRWPYLGRPRSTCLSACARSATCVRFSCLSFRPSLPCPLHGVRFSSAFGAGASAIPFRFALDRAILDLALPLTSFPGLACSAFAVCARVFVGVLWPRYSIWVISHIEMAYWRLLCEYRFVCTARSARLVRLRTPRPLCVP